MITMSKSFQSFVVTWLLDTTCGGSRTTWRHKLQMRSDQLNESTEEMPRCENAEVNRNHDNPSKPTYSHRQQCETGCGSACDVRLLCEIIAKTRPSSWLSTPVSLIECWKMHSSWCHQWYCAISVLWLRLLARNTSATRTPHFHHQQCTFFIGLPLTAQDLTSMWQECFAGLKTHLRTIFHDLLNWLLCKYCSYQVLQSNDLNPQTNKKNTKCSRLHLWRQAGFRD